MMADLKDEISVSLAGSLARELTAAWPAFPRARFTRGLGDALAPLALLARVELLTDRLVEALPDDFHDAAAVLWRLWRLVADPGPNLELLDRLVDDPSGYVRRSVANHLNDIAKDHPDLAIELAGRWLPRGDPAAWAVRHGLRTLVKRGDPRALALLGADPDADIRLTALTVDRTTVPIGEAVTFTLAVELHGAAAADAVVDYRIHYVGADGRRRPKVFKLARRRLLPGQPATVTRRHRFEHVSIRRVRPGRHSIDVQVNGRVLGTVDVEVVESGADGTGHDQHIRPVHPL